MRSSLTGTANGARDSLRHVGEYPPPRSVSIPGSLRATFTGGGNRTTRPEPRFISTCHKTTNNCHYRTYDAGRSGAEAAPKAKRIPLWRACCSLPGLGWSIQLLVSTTSHELCGDHGSRGVPAVEYRVNSMLSVVDNQHVVDVPNGCLQASSATLEVGGLAEGGGSFDRLGKLDGHPIHGGVFNETG